MTAEVILTDEQRVALFTDNFKLADWAVRKYGHGRLSRDDYFQVACVGLLHAARYWNPNYQTNGRLTTFAAYAKKCMQREIQRTEDEQGRTIRQSARSREQYGELILEDFADLEPVTGDPWSPDPEQQMLLDEQAAQLRQIIAQQHLDLLDASDDLPRKHKRHMHDWSSRDVMDLLVQGDNHATIAKKLGVSRQRIGQIVTRVRKHAAAAQSGEEERGS